jgi:tripartite-type tricarboxylate transporter receptor subunit TctC
LRRRHDWIEAGRRCCARRVHHRARGTHAPGQTLYKKPLYSATNDFTPVALTAEVPIVLIARKDLPVINLSEFIAYAKANQNKTQDGSDGASSATHLGRVLLNYLVGVDITHVPIAAPALQRRIDYHCEVISTAKPQSMAVP